ncbi:hypothetical protein HNQ93_001147 [Hymenobacter luteus]|uniref:Uncharacterized protein n=1 Tax=Hymenobacter luteus TaxID=1411122 RepID=A0A7W9SYW7_9BACT|nr:hypothetical protein [Hymenobacter luteus]
MAALGAKVSDHTSGYIADTVRDEYNKKKPWFGFITIAWVGVVVLLENGNETTYATAKQLVDEWEADEKAHFINWLNDYLDYVQILNG